MTLTTGQSAFIARLAGDTGLDPGVVTAWVLAEESGAAAMARERGSNHDWLNIGYTDTGTFGAGASVWRNPLTAADATAGWLKGGDTVPGYGRASSGIRAILGTAGQSPAAQIGAIQRSGWASSGYPTLPAIYSSSARLAPSAAAGGLTSIPSTGSPGGLGAFLLKLALTAGLLLAGAFLVIYGAGGLLGFSPGRAARRVARVGVLA